jgi:predicted cobalt transporter CbtA
MIFQRLIWAALAVAVLVGSVQSGVQQLQAVPIILAAEVFEGQKVEAPEPAAPARDGRCPYACRWRCA